MLGSMSTTARALPTRPFRLLRWFALVSAAVIGALALANALLMSQFLTERLFQREGEVSSDFVQNILVSDGSLAFLDHPQDPDLKARFQGSVVHLGNLHEVLRANVYGRDQRVLWSTNAALVGQRFHDNEELGAALAGELVVHAGRVGGGELTKAEYAGLPRKAAYFVETYIPVRDASQRVVGVVELYKTPVALTEAIHAAYVQIAWLALAGAALLFGSLYGLVRRADRTLRQQQAQLMDANTLAAVGELAAAVAHNIRNPLASIRSSAELTLEAPLEHATDSARDILRDADRIAARIDDLLRLSGTTSDRHEAINLHALLRQCAKEQAPVFERRQQRLVCDVPEGLATVQGDARLLRQTLDSLLANASEAMQAGGQCTLSLAPTRAGWHRVSLVDTGHGIAPEALGKVLRPFVTTKPQGLGLGLAMARRVVERLGGELHLESQLGEGTAVQIDLPTA